MGFIDQHRWENPDFWWGDATTGGAANPQLQFFENFPGHLGANFNGLSNNTLSVHAVNIPLSLSFNTPVVLFRAQTLVSTDFTATAQVYLGLYSLNGSTLSLANSASASSTYSSNGGQFTSWMSLNTSATQNITPGTWYFGIVGSISGSGGGGIGFPLWGNSSINPGNAIPGGFLMGRMTASTTAMPASIATSDLDITGSDAIKQLYIIITA